MAWQGKDGVPPHNDGVTNQAAADDILPHLFDLRIHLVDRLLPLIHIYLMIMSIVAVKPTHFQIGQLSTGGIILRDLLQRNAGPILPYIYVQKHRDRNSLLFSGVREETQGIHIVAQGPELCFGASQESG